MYLFIYLSFQVIAIPARDVTSVAWGGPELDILYVTTSRFSLKPQERKQFPSAGSVFALKNLGTKGLAPYTADIVDSIEKKLVSNPQIKRLKNCNNLLIT